MESPNSIHILFGLVSFGFFLLCVVIIYLCVMVRRIRRDVDELIRNKNANISLEDIRNKEAVNVRERTISGNPRYTGDPVNWRKRKHNSSIYSEPGEPVIFLERNDSQSNAGSTQQVDMEYALTIQNPTVTEIQATPQQIPYQYSNKGFISEITRNSTVRQNKEAVDGRKRTISSYLPGDPGKGKRQHNSSIYSEPGEPVILLGSSLSEPNAGSTRHLGMKYALPIQNPSVTEIQAIPQQISYQYSNEGFRPEIPRNSSVSDGVSDDSQPVHGSGEVLSDNNGELAARVTCCPCLC